MDNSWDRNTTKTSKKYDTTQKTRTMSNTDTMKTGDNEGYTVPVSYKTPTILPQSRDTDWQHWAHETLNKDKQTIRRNTEN